MSTLKRISLEYMGRKIKFWMVNAELVEELTKFRTTSKPHFLCFKDGEQLEVVEGVNAPALLRSSQTTYLMACSTLRRRLLLRRRMRKRRAEAMHLSARGSWPLGLAGQNIVRRSAKKHANCGYFGAGI